MRSFPKMAVFFVYICIILRSVFLQRIVQAQPLAIPQGIQKRLFQCWLAVKIDIQSRIIARYPTKYLSRSVTIIPINVPGVANIAGNTRFYASKNSVAH
jgi:hypothetical protein